MAKFPLKTRIIKLERRTQDIAVMRIAVPEGLKYKAGQYARLSVADHDFRPFSIANGTDSDFIEFHFKDSGQGVSHFLFHSAREGDEVTIEMIGGANIPTHDGTRPILMIAGGTGFAPMKAMIEDLVKNNDPREILLYVGVRDDDNFYFSQDLQKLIAGAQASGTKLRVEIVYSEQDKKGALRGYVGDVASRAHWDRLKEFDIFVSGPPAMVQPTLEKLGEAGVDDANIYCDLKPRPAQSKHSSSFKPKQK